MKSLGIPRGAWVLFLLLAIATAMILFGSKESESDPNSASYGPSGVRAFRTLLEKNGYKTRQSLSTIRQIGKDEVAIAIFRASDAPDLQLDDWHQRSPIGSVLKRHFDNGGRAMLVSIPTNFRDSSRIALASPSEIESSLDSSRRKVSIGSTESYGDWTNFAYSDKDYLLWTTANQSSFVWIDKVGAGTMVGLANGLPMTNRFLDKEDNARTVFEAIRAASGPHRSVVFLEAAHGLISESSLVEVIGPWANGAWWQLTMVFVVLVAVLGIRFGYPDRVRSRQRGTREIADAMGDLFARSGATEVAMRALMEDADRQVRKRLKIAGDTPREVRDRALPEALASAFAYAENAADSRAPVSVALPIARMLDYETAKFVGYHDRRPARRRR